MSLEQGEVAGMAWRDIAASACRAFTACRIAQGSIGHWPPFDELSRDMQIAWEAAVRQAVMCSLLEHSSKPPDEQHWAGWTPEQPSRAIPDLPSPDAEPNGGFNAVFE